MEKWSVMLHTCGVLTSVLIIHLKATEQYMYFLVFLFIILNKVILIFGSVDKICKCDHSYQSYWRVLSYGAVHYAEQAKVVLTFVSVDKICKCGHSYQSYWGVLSCGAVHYAAQGGSNFCVYG